MILESLVTTTNSDGSPNLSPMGPIVQDASFQQFELRPYDTSTTFANLKRHGQGVLHVDDNVDLFARSAVEKLAGSDLPPLSPAKQVEGFIIDTACRSYEFKVNSVDETGSRMSLRCEVLHVHRQRDFFGFNRAKHAVLEAAIFATRTEFLPATEILEQFDRLAVVVDKTAGPVELESFQRLQHFVNSRLGR
jgi:hypothetical protein